MASENPPPPSADVVSNGGVSSPQSRRRTPWASVVRGYSDQNSSPTAVSPGSSSSPLAEQTSVSDSSPIENLESVTQPPPESSEVNGDGNAGGRPRRSAWNRPSNGVVEPASVMGGAVSWPALSETTRGPVPRSSADTARPGFDGSPAAFQAPIISQPPQRPVNNNAHAVGNNPTPNRPRSRNRNTGGGGSSSSSSGNGPSQNTPNQPPPMMMPPPFPYEVPPPPPPYGMVPPVMDTSVRGPRPAGGSQSHTGGDPPSQRNNNPRRGGGYGPRPRGDGGPYHNNRRDQGRRDVHHHPPQFVPPSIGYMTPPMPPAAPFMAPPAMRVFPGQVGFDVGPTAFFMGPAMPPPEPFRTLPPGVPPPPPPMMYPPPIVTENPLPSMIVKQIDFYFSDDNLVKDIFLRSKMDDHGWVPISLIASFRRVELLTKDIPLILDSLRYSTVVEVQGDKLRRRNEWNKWLPLSGRPNSDAGPSGSNTAPENALATSLHEVSLDDATTSANGNTDAIEGQTSLPAAESTANSGLANGEDTSEENIHS